MKNAQLVNKQSSGILYFIETKIRNRQLHSTQLLGIDKYSLEHLMPKKWENHWNNLTNPEDAIKRNRKLLTLGNLTIITQTLNSTIRDANWDVKKNGRDKNGLNTYSAGLETINPFLSLAEWNENAIDNRAEFLFNKAREIWSIQH